jgi:hypothetical protein
MSMASALHSLTRLLAVLGHAAELMQMACRLKHYPNSPNAYDRMLGFGSVPCLQSMGDEDVAPATRRFFAPLFCSATWIVRRGAPANGS